MLPLHIYQSRRSSSPLAAKPELGSNGRDTTGPRNTGRCSLMPASTWSISSSSVAPIVSSFLWCDNPSPSGLAAARYFAIAPG
jgi:hypothetical protein